MIGLIIAAGKQRRFKDSIPKALVEINGEPILKRNYSILKQYCNDVYVITSETNNYQFSNLKQSIRIINIGESGKGSGDAIFEAIKQLLIDKEETMVICWGDTILNENVFKYLPDTYDNNYVYIPATFEKKPYVQLKDNKVFFSKYKDKIDKEGYHDSCMFIGNVDLIYDACKKFRAKYYNFSTDLQYEHIHGNEFEFLDLFNDTDLKYKIIEIDYNDRNFSFNTKKEFEAIKSLKEVG